MDNFHYMDQIFIQEKECLDKCNDWLQKNNVRYENTNKQVKFSNMLELEIFVLQTKNRIKQQKLQFVKYGSMFGAFLGTLTFCVFNEKSFTGKDVLKIFSLPAFGGGIISFLLSEFQTVCSRVVSLNYTNIDFPKFQLFFESCFKNYYNLKQKLMQ
ncbi:transmembrane protein, putative (macronuclear) [Tetrahymena thermophila SB210]|uniref:Transmembrane protein, putative n=1 Tax=Tetrahymena thermophila (strain SB210) TaxID=312017 RepID=W7X6J6_TETTS|nr:transmembrane protein, putative [Tetrahymena thermophila SB210]EWS71988.1 transmembrane protein, putative [Tetrahymena thermophila SB210]|eukprot:XP_012655488.1 transmembrane protein, putative [Tetrahymena thermophila SB210]